MRQAIWHSLCPASAFMTVSRLWAVAAAFAILSVPGLPSIGRAQTIEPDAPSEVAQPPRVTCESTPGTREHCAADTSSGVVLARSFGSAACLLGKTWGYDDTGIFVSEGCSGEFVVGEGTQPAPPERTRPLEHIPNVGFLLYNGEKGKIYFWLFSYARYLKRR